MPNRALKILVSILIVGVAILTIGRNHFLFGTALIMFRWVLFGVGLVFLYLLLKRDSSRVLKLAVTAALLVLVTEWAWNKFQEKELSSALTSTEVTVMTYNIFFRNFDLEATLQNINTVNPDILAIQELTPDLESKLEKAIGATYRYRETFSLRRTQGFGLYSKYRILSSRILMNVRNHPFAQIVELEVEGKKVQVINTHLASPAVAIENPDNFWSLYIANYDQRKNQLNQLHALAIQTEKLYDLQLMMGDLNTTTYEPLYRDIKKEWVNLYDISGIGSGRNFPHSNKIPKLLTLDYMLGRGSVMPIELKVIDGGGSDHLAIAGKIKI